MILETLTILLVFTSTLKTTTGPIDPAPLRIASVPAEQYFIDNLYYMTPVLWHHGCSPTAAGMAFSYWDRRGYDLLPGDLQTETTLQEVIASLEHYADYSLPMDYGGDVLFDKSEPPPGDEHVDNSVADMMDTSQSAASLAYGWTWIGHIQAGMSAWIITRGYTPTVMGYFYSQYSDVESWDLYAREIDDDHPVLLNILTPRGLHSVAGVGYGYQSGQRFYAVYNTWSKNIVWYEWGKNGTPYSVVMFYTLDVEGEVRLPVIHSVYLPVVFRQ